MKKNNKLENAVSLYLEGIRDGKIDVIDHYTGDRYTQHSTGVADGLEGFKAFFKDFLERTSTRDIQVIRTIEDGNYIFVQVYQDIDNGAAKWVTMDLFDTDENDKIIEHWDVIAPYIEPGETVSGNDMILGAFEIRDRDKTEENKALVRSFLTEVFQNKKHHLLDQFVSRDTYIEHNPHLPNGFETMESILASQVFNYDFIFKVVGEGDHVAVLSKGVYDGEELCIFDLYRIENGRIVEHWDNMEPIPPRNEWANSGKF